MRFVVPAGLRLPGCLPIGFRGKWTPQQALSQSFVIQLLHFGNLFGGRIAGYMGCNGISVFFG